MKIELTKENISATFNHAISERKLPFQEFIEKYL